MRKDWKNRLGAGVLVVLVSVAGGTSMLGAENFGESGYMGVGFEVDRDTGVLSVARVTPGGPSERHGVRVGDVLHTVSGAAVRFSSNRAALEFFAATLVAGKPVAMTYERDGEPIKLRIAPTERPADLDALNARRLLCIDGARPSALGGQRAGPRFDAAAEPGARPPSVVSACQRTPRGALRRLSGMCWAWAT